MMSCPKFCQPCMRHYEPSGVQSQGYHQYVLLPTHTIGSTIASWGHQQARQNHCVGAGFGQKRFPPVSVSSHSLHAGGTMAMHLNHINCDKIWKQGRWSSDTFLMYIHEQILAFSHGLSTKMSTEIGFHNIDGPMLTEPQTMMV